MKSSQGMARSQACCSCRGPDAPDGRPDARNHVQHARQPGRQFRRADVADLFAGSGALGLEALSRGAASCLFVEQDAQATKAIRTNIEVLGARPKCVVQQASVMGLGPAKVPHDLVLLDPPYDTGAGHVALDRLARLGWIGEATWIALEIGAREIANCARSRSSPNATGKARFCCSALPLNLLRLTFRQFRSRQLPPCRSLPLDLGQACACCSADSPASVTLLASEIRQNRLCRSGVSVKK